MSINGHLDLRVHNSRLNASAVLALALTSLIPFQRARAVMPIDLLAGTVAEIHSKHKQSPLTIEAVKFQNTIKITGAACAAAESKTDLQVFCARSAKTLVLHSGEGDTEDKNAKERYQIPGQAVASSETLIKCWDPGSGEQIRCTDPVDPAELAAKAIALKNRKKNHPSIRVVSLAATYLNSIDSQGADATDTLSADALVGSMNDAPAVELSEDPIASSTVKTLEEQLTTLRGARNKYYEKTISSQAVTKNYIDTRQLNIDAKRLPDPMTDAFAVIPTGARPQTFRDLGHAYKDPLEGSSGLPPKVKNSTNVNNVSAKDNASEPALANDIGDKPSSIGSEFGEAARAILIGVVASTASRYVLTTLGVKAFAATGILVGMPGIAAVGLSIAGFALTGAVASGLSRAAVHAYRRRSQGTQKGWFMREFAKGAMWGFVGGAAVGAITDIISAEMLSLKNVHHVSKVIKAGADQIIAKNHVVTKVLPSILKPNGVAQTIITPLKAINAINSAAQSATTLTSDALTKVSQSLANAAVSLHQGLTADQFAALSKHTQALANLKSTHGILHFIKDASYELVNNKNTNMVNAGISLMKRGLMQAGSNAHGSVVQMLNRDLGIMDLLRDHNALSAIEHAKHAGKFGAKLLIQATKYAAAHPG